jgi:hypothetical protein
MTEPEPLICDFCSEPHVGRRFHCEDFVLDQTLPQLRSKGDWMACSTCGGLIDAGAWDNLLLHAVNKLGDKYPEMPHRILADAIRRSHDLFRIHYRKEQK